jgi:hypothetical protein
MGGVELRVGVNGGLKVRHFGTGTGRFSENGKETVKKQ